MILLCTPPKCPAHTRVRAYSEPGACGTLVHLEGVSRTERAQEPLRADERGTLWRSDQKCGMGTRAGWVDEGSPKAVNSITLRGCGLGQSVTVRRMNRHSTGANSSKMVFF